MDYNYSFQNLSRIEKVQAYLLNTKPVLNIGALFSDGTQEYRRPVEPTIQDDVKVRLRTAKRNVDYVYLIFINQGVEKKVRAVPISSNRQFDFYEAVIPKSEEPTEYYFEIQAGKMTCYYNRRGVQQEPTLYYNFRITPGFHTPAWAKGAVFYQIFVDRFYNGDPSNDVIEREYSYINESVTQVSDWNKIPATMGVREFYGGDLQGVMDKLDYLQDLGVEVVYLNPIFVSPSNHKYDIQDYDYVDPHYGRIVKDEGDVLNYGDNNNQNASRYIQRVTDKANLEASNQLFIELVEEIHRRGMRIILDGVFNHCGSFNRWLDRERIYENQEGYPKGAFIEENSQYHSYFKFYNKDVWPYNTSYDGWWGHDTLPKLNYEESPELYQEIMRIARKWVSPPFNVDGWRLDVAADLGHSSDYNHQFWADFRKNVKEANPEAIILAEHYGDPYAWLQGDQWDTVMNYDAFMEPITWFLTGVEKHSDEYRADLKNNYDTLYGAITHHNTRFHTQSLEVAMNELSNHDHSRFLTRTNGRVGRIASVGAELASQFLNYGIFREGIVIQMTWTGAPTIYYGDEAGVCGWTDPDNRRTYPWGHEDQSLINLHKELIRIHKNHLCIREGSFKFLHGEYGILSYGRFIKDERIVVAFNNNDHERQVKIPAWEAGFESQKDVVQLIMTTAEGYTTEPVIHSLVSGSLYLTMPATSAIILEQIS